MFFLKNLARKGLRLDSYLDINALWPRQNGRHFADDIFKCIFVNEKFCILTTISVNFGPKGPIDNNPALV